MLFFSLMTITVIILMVELVVVSYPRVHTVRCDLQREESTAELEPASAPTPSALKFPRSIRTDVNVNGRAMDPTANTVRSTAFNLFLFCSGVIIPLLKGKHGDASSLDMYRGITIAPAASKLFELILLRLYEDISVQRPFAVRFQKE